MKLNIILMLLSTFLIAAHCTHGQKVTDSELKSYAIALDSIETLKNIFSIKMRNVSQGNEKISTQRYSILIPLVNDAVSLLNAKATQDEIAYVKRALAIQQDETLKFQKSYQSLITDYVGEAIFSKVRNALKSDTSLSVKYDSLMLKLKQPKKPH